MSMTYAAGYNWIKENMMVFPADAGTMDSFMAGFAPSRTTGETTANGFWVRPSQFFSFHGEKPNDRLVPFGVIKEITMGFMTKEIWIALSKERFLRLPQRWQMEADWDTTAAPLRGQVIAPLERSAPNPMPAPAPVMSVPAFADAQAMSETVVAQFSQKATLIREIAKIQAAMESEHIPESLKQILAQEAEAAYERLKTISEITDAAMSAYLSQNGR